jgi:hypothetical protein
MAAESGIDVPPRRYTIPAEVRDLIATALSPADGLSWQLRDVPVDGRLVTVELDGEAVEDLTALVLDLIEPGPLRDETLEALGADG